MENLNKKITLFVLASSFVGSLFIFACNSSTASKKGPAEKKTELDEAKCSAKANLKIAMRKLWEDHVTWTRNVILNIIDDLPGKDEALKRLLKNQDDIGNAIKPYYGDEAGKKLTELLHTHIVQSGDLLKAVKANNKTAIDDIIKKWYVNADEISAFLCGANPNWKLDEMKTMMHEHLKLTTDEALARQQKNYAADVQAYDKVHEEILKMSDMLYMGIVTHFPDKVK
ncbi:MAG: glycosyltransferase [Bacteroidota bacterium]|nr:glycosyltransferase [Bacteroidota bacterium]